MNTFEKCEAIRDLILRRTSEILLYNWSDDFKMEQIKEIPVIVSKWEEEHGSFKVNPYELTEEQMKDLGFSSWSEGSNVMLIPLWLYQYLPENIDTVSISGSKHTTKSEIDTDHRFGNLAFGILHDNCV